ncbi:MAG: DUF5012 domain-containing protein [Prevotellaceae bacterium]|jgi:hypothetical protein|nr:DUF5012 domain-containing protein [Prevotellaceae bacterium]
MKRIFCIISVISLILASCSGDIFDNIKEHIEAEKVYVGKFDKADGRVGLNRVEIDLLDAGRIPANKVNIGKAVKTIIEYDKEKITLNEIPSWINITNLTEARLYRFSIYNLDEYGNKSIPVEVALIPFTDADYNDLDVAAPSFTIAPTAAEFVWGGGLSSSFLDYISLTYTYTDKNGVVQTETTNETKFAVVNLVDGAETEVKVVYTIVPILNNEQIIDTLTLERTYTVVTNTEAEYLATRVTRTVKEPFRDGNAGILTWGPTTDHAVWSEVRYINTSGTPVVVRTLASDSVAACPDVKPGELFETRTAFIPPGPPVEYVEAWSRSTVPFLNILSGDYTVLSTSYRLAEDGSTSTVEYSNNNNPVTITATGPEGVYELSDMFGGYYEIGRGYGTGYRISGKIKYDGANFSLFSANMDPWGYGFSACRGTYGEATKTLSLEIDWSSYIFYLDIKKNE